MKTKTKKHYIYVNINKYTVTLVLLANILNVSKYQLMLLYETFHNDLFLVIDMFHKAGLFPELTEFRLNRSVQHADRIAEVLLGNVGIVLGTTEIRSMQQVQPFLFENKLKIEEDIEAFR